MHSLTIHFEIKVFILFFFLNDYIQRFSILHETEIFHGWRFMPFSDEVRVLLWALTRGKRERREESQISFYTPSCPQHSRSNTGLSSPCFCLHVHLHRLFFFFSLSPLAASVTQNFFLCWCVKLSHSADLSRLWAPKSNALIKGEGRAVTLAVPQDVVRSRAAPSHDVPLGPAAAPGRTTGAGVCGHSPPIPSVIYIWKAGFVSFLPPIQRQPLILWRDGG